MVVASGQMPYEYSGPLPVRTLVNAWPGVGRPNIGASGDLFEQAMFVYNAELRKWNFPDQLDLLQYTCYVHPDVTPTTFEPDANGDNLVGTSGIACILTPDNIEQMRTQMVSYLFNYYSDDSVYGTQDFLESWLQTAYPESESGVRKVIQVIPPLPIYSTLAANFLRPPLEDVTGGDNHLDLDLHWLGGSGVLHDIDYGEVIFNPFPFPREGFFFAPTNENYEFAFGPVYPLVQTTAGAIPSVLASRYQSDLAAGTFSAQTNFDALESGVVQIDGYVLLDGTIMELVRGNDQNFDATLGGTTDYTNHVQGLRRVRDGVGDNDPSARCYRTPNAKASGQYRFITYNTKANVPYTAIPSGFVSMWPEGRTIKAEPGGDQILNNNIWSQSVSQSTDGALILSPTSSNGIHVMDDALWFTGPNDSTDASGGATSSGMFIMSPHNGQMVWYRPAELVLATSGNMPSSNTNPGRWGGHIGIESLNATEFVRLSRVHTTFLSMDTLTVNLHFEIYNKTTLNHREQDLNFSFTQTSTAPSLGSRLDSFHWDGSNYWINGAGGRVTRLTSALGFDSNYTSPLARRRHRGNGKDLYTIGGSVQAGDPLLSVTPNPLDNIGSGIGEWSIFSAPVVGTDPGVITHDAGKMLRAETIVGHQSTAIIHMIRDISGATHVRDGTWCLIQYGDDDLYLMRIEEGASEWTVLESIKINDITGDNVIGGVPADFPHEFILHDID